MSFFIYCHLCGASISVYNWIININVQHGSWIILLHENNTNSSWGVSTSVALLIGPDIWWKSWTNSAECWANALPTCDVTHSGLKMIGCTHCLYAFQSVIINEVQCSSNLLFVQILLIVDSKFLLSWIFLGASHVGCKCNIRSSSMHSTHFSTLSLPLPLLSKHQLIERGFLIQDLFLNAKKWLLFCV